MLGVDSDSAAARRGHHELEEAVRIGDNGISFGVPDADPCTFDAASSGHNDSPETTRRLLQPYLRPRIRVVALSAHSDSQFVTEMLRAGANAYLLKEAAYEELVLALRAVMAGKKFLSPQITGAVVKEFLRAGAPSVSSGEPALSSRESEVLQLLAGSVEKDKVHL